MSFKPVESTGNGDSNKEYAKFKDNEEGTYSVGARCSLLVDMGIQSRPDEEWDYKEEQHKAQVDKGSAVLFEEDGKTKVRISKPDVQCVAVFIDVPSERHNYGEEIGERGFRMLINQRDFKSGLIKGTPLTIMHPMTPDGKFDSSKPKNFHSRSLLTKLGKAVGIRDWSKEGYDIQKLLGKPFLATIDNKLTGAGKIFTKYSDCSPMPDGMKVDELDDEPMAISFETATADQVKFIWKNLREQLKTAKNYEGSQMQAAIEEFESQQNTAPASTPDSNMANDMGAEDDDDNSPPF